MKTNHLRTRWIQFGVLAVVGLVLAFTALSAQAYDRQSNSENRARVDVVPVQLAPDQPILFEIRMNTHSVPLENDMAADSVLQDDNGNIYAATQWEGTPPGGHHRSGILHFSALKGASKSVTLVVKGVAGVRERVYQWTIE